MPAAESTGHIATAHAGPFLGGWAPIRRLFLRLRAA